MINELKMVIEKSSYEERQGIICLITEKVEGLLELLHGMEEYNRQYAVDGNEVELASQIKVIESISEKIELLLDMLKLFEEGTPQQDEAGDLPDITGEESEPINDNRNAESELMTAINQINVGKAEDEFIPPVEEGEPVPSEDETSKPEENYLEDKNKEQDLEKECGDKKKATIKAFQIMKANEFLGVIYGIASKADFVDSEGDIIEIDELRKAAHDYISKSRNGNVDHRRGNVGEVVESLILDNDMVNAIKSNRIEEGSWIIGWKPFDPVIAKKASMGEYVGFSIEGTGRRIPV